jgi:hypothetical protein
MVSMLNNKKIRENFFMFCCPIAETNMRGESLEDGEYSEPNVACGKLYRRKCLLFVRKNTWQCSDDGR